MFCNIVDIKLTDRIQYDGDTFEIINVSNPDNVNKYLVLDLKIIK